MNLIKFCLFFIFGHWAKRNRLSGKIVSEKGQNCFLCVQKILLRKKFISKKVFFIHFWYLSQRRSVFLSFFSWQVFQKCFIRVQKEVLRKKVFLKKIDVFYCHFRTLSEKPLVLCRHVFGRIVKTAIYLLVGTFREEFFFSKKNFSLLFIPGYWAEKCRTYGIFSGKLSKLLFIFPEVKSEKESFLDKKNSSFFGNWAEYCQIYVKKFRAGISKLHSMFWKWSVEETLVFSNWLNFFKKNLVILSEKCWRNFFYEYNFFHFRSVSNRLSSIVFFPSTWLLNLLSTCPWVLFRGKYFFLRNIFSFSLNFRTLSEELLVFRREVFSRFFKTEFQVHTRTTWGFFFRKAMF